MVVQQDDAGAQGQVVQILEWQTDTSKNLPFKG